MGKDHRAYTASEFRNWYGDQWDREWLSAPKEMRQARDGSWRTYDEFLQYYGSSNGWTRWHEARNYDREPLHAAKPVERRMGKDHRAYTASEFRNWYGDQWYREWLSAPQEMRQARDGSRWTYDEFM